MIRLICGGILIFIGLFIMLLGFFMTLIEGTSDDSLATDLIGVFLLSVVPVGFGVLLIRGHFKKKHIRKALQEAQEKLRVEGGEIFDGILLVGKIKRKATFLDGPSALLTIGDTSYKLYREICGDWVLLLEESDHVLARANAWQKYRIIEYEGNQYTLEPESIPWWRLAWRTPFILRCRRYQIGSVRALSSSKAIVDLPKSMPIAVRVFIFWIVEGDWDTQTRVPSV